MSGEVDNASIRRYTLQRFIYMPSDQILIASTTVKYLFAELTLLKVTRSLLKGFDINKVENG
jgi:hypothetical protein